MVSAHVYQNSLRVAARRAEASLLLVPAAGGAPWLEDPATHARERVGAMVLHPGMDIAGGCVAAYLPP
jgi:hypothetical protein